MKNIIKYQLLFLFFLFGCGGEFIRGPQFVDGGMKKLADFLEDNYDIESAEVSPIDYSFDKTELPIIIVNPKFDGELRIPSENELLPIVELFRSVILDISKYNLIGIGVQTTINDTTFYNYYKFPIVHEAKEN